MPSAGSCRAFLAAQGVDLAFVKDTGRRIPGTAIITLANADNTIVVVPGASGLVDAERGRRRPSLAKGDVAVSQFEIPLPTIAAFFSAPARPAPPRSSIRRRRNRPTRRCWTWSTS